MIRHIVVCVFVCISNFANTRFHSKTSAASAYFFVCIYVEGTFTTCFCHEASVCESTQVLSR